MTKYIISMTKYISCHHMMIKMMYFEHLELDLRRIIFQEKNLAYLY